MHRRGRHATSLLTVVLVATGCSLTAGSPAPTPCGGSHDWPPNDYVDRPLPAGVLVERAGRTTIRVRNESQQAWTFRTAIWTDSPCVGFIADGLPRSLIGPGHLVQSQFDPHDPTLDTKVAVEVYEPECDEACVDPPVGFGWIDVLVPLPS